MSLKRTRSNELSTNGSHANDDHRNVKQKLLHASSSPSSVSEKMTRATIVVPGTALPNFDTPALLDRRIGAVSRSHYRGSWLCIVFYPLDFTDSSKDTIIEYSKKHQEFATENCKVIFCSTDSCYVHLAWTGKLEGEPGVSQGSLPTLLSDSSHQLTESFGFLDSSSGTARHGFIVADPTLTVHKVEITDRSVDMDAMLRAVQHYKTDY